MRPFRFDYLGDLQIVKASHYNEYALIIPVRIVLNLAFSEMVERLPMFYDPAGPIERFEWGYFQINGEVHSDDGDGVGKDICIVRGDVLPWKERVGHKIKPEMVAPILKEGLAILVIGTGVKGRLSVTKKTRQAIIAAGIEPLWVEKTPVACAIYNRLFHEGKSVGLLAHGTC